jgi:hypothetical protein
MEAHQRDAEWVCKWNSTAAAPTLSFFFLQMEKIENLCSKKF